MDDASNAGEIVVFAPLFEPAVLGGGPISTLKALLTASPRSRPITLMTSSRDLDGSPLRLTKAMTRYGHVDVRYSDQAKTVAHLAAIARIVRRRPQFVYINGFFDARFSIAPQLVNAALARRPRLIAPRGEMSPQALAISASRKRVYMALYRALGLHRGVVWHASSEREAADIRAAWGRSAVVLVRENETSLPERAELPAASVAPFSVSFVGRLVPNKGLHVLLEALHAVRAPVQLHVGGPPENERYLEMCRGIIATLPERHRVTIHGLLQPDAVRSFIRRTDIFAFPTETENFGHVIAEALSTARPVLVPDTTPWTPIISGGGGSVVPSREADDWAQALERYAAMTPQQRLQESGRAMEAYNEWTRARSGEHIFATAVTMGALGAGSR